MIAAVVDSPGGPFRIEERSPPTPGPDDVRVKVHACGYCLSDENIRSGATGADFPRVPGHEAAGTIEAVGSAVPPHWREGDRVGVGWHGGHCLACDACRHGRFLRCASRQACGTSFDGGFQEYLVAPWTALARIPDEVPFDEAGPIMCAGITVWNALRASGATWGDRVAVQGLGGLGHLAVQYADAMGFETVAVSRGSDKADLARDLGADHYVDADDEGALKAIKADAVVTTVPSGAAMQAMVPALAPGGRMTIVGASGEEMRIRSGRFLTPMGIQGSVIGTPAEIEDCLKFGALKGIRPWIESFALDDIHAAQKRLLEGSLRFRAVLTMAP